MMNPEMPHRHAQNATKQPSDEQVLEWLGFKHSSEVKRSQAPKEAVSSGSLQENRTIEKELSMSWRGARSEVVIGFVNHNGRSEIRRVTVHGLGPSGEKLVVYKSLFSPSDRVSDAIVKLLKSKPRNVNIDQYLTDIGDLLRADKRNDLVLVRPTSQTERREVYPMEVEAPSFREFAKAPGVLANRFMAAWSRNSCRYECRGMIQPDASTACLEITTSSEQGSIISADRFDVLPERRSFSSRRERHNHLRTRIWEAIEVFRTEGTAAVEYVLPRSEEGQAPWNVDAEVTLGASSADLAELPRQVNGEVLHVCESVGGATVALEVSRAQAAISIVLPMQDLVTGVLLTFKSTVEGAPLSAAEVGVLKGLTADLASQDESVRRQARTILVEKSTAMQACSEPVRALYPSFELEESLPVLMAFRPYQRDQSYLIDWVLDGYHTAVFTHDYLAPDSQSSAHNFFEMVLGISADGDIKLRLTHDNQENCSAVIPAGIDAELDVARGRAQNILDVFTDQTNHSWDAILGFVQELSVAEGGKVCYERLVDGRRLPPLSDKTGIIALSKAAGVVAACASSSRLVTPESVRMYAGEGAAMAFIRYRDMPVSLGVSFKGDRITRLGCYEVTAGSALNECSLPLISVEPSFRASDPETISKAIGLLSETFAELLRNPESATIKANKMSSEAIRSIFRAALTRCGAQKSVTNRA